MSVVSAGPPGLAFRKRPLWFQGGVAPGRGGGLAVCLPDWPREEHKGLEKRSVHVCVGVCVSVYVYVHLCACVRVCICDVCDLCVRECMPVLVHVCLCVSMRERERYSDWSGICKPGPLSPNLRLPGLRIAHALMCPAMCIVPPCFSSPSSPVPSLTPSL